MHWKHCFPFFYIKKIAIWSQLNISYFLLYYGSGYILCYHFGKAICIESFLNCHSLHILFKRSESIVFVILSHNKKIWLSNCFFLSFSFLILPKISTLNENMHVLCAVVQFWVFGKNCLISLVFALWKFCTYAMDEDLV